ncbi:hypothetical protein [Macrococcoides canis]|uniref:hypothetical protein n=1 Tax=Macrococcoides canis TaxID=1855823 RepID=UPI0022B8EC0D|nr:hypothetical protein [Macrococcus canis]WBF53986.1 hypothetical protein LL975_12190 [Macrococcus canis]
MFEFILIVVFAIIIFYWLIPMAILIVTKEKNLEKEDAIRRQIEDDCHNYKRRVH